MVVMRKMKQSAELLIKIIEIIGLNLVFTNDLHSRMLYQETLFTVIHALITSSLEALQLIQNFCHSFIQSIFSCFLSKATQGIKHVHSNGAP